MILTGQKDSHCALSGTVPEKALLSNHPAVCQILFTALVDGDGGEDVF